MKPAKVDHGCHRGQPAWDVVDSFLVWWLVRMFGQEYHVH